MNKCSKLLSALVVAGLLFSGAVFATENAGTNKKTSTIKPKPAHSTVIAQSTSAKAPAHKFTTTAAKKAKSKAAVNKVTSKRSTYKGVGKRHTGTQTKKFEANAKALMF